MPDTAPAPCSTRPEPQLDAAPISQATQTQTPRPGMSPPKGPQLGWPCWGGDASPCQRAPSDPTAPSSTSTLQPRHPLSFFPVPGGGAGSWGGFGSMPPGVPCGRWPGGAGQGLPQGHTAGLCQEATQMGTSWGDMRTRHSALQGSNTDGDILGGTQGHDSSLWESNTAGVDGDSLGGRGHTAVLCRAATAMGTSQGKMRTHSSALLGSNVDGDILRGHTGTDSDTLPGSSRDILGTHRDTTDKQVAPGAKMPARDDAVAAGWEARWAQNSRYCFTGPTSRGGQAGAPVDLRFKGLSPGTDSPVLPVPPPSPPPTDTGCSHRAMLGGDRVPAEDTGLDTTKQG